MTEYDVTPEGSRVLRSVKGPQEPGICADGHIWDLNGDPGAPLECMICGQTRGLMTTQELKFLRDNLLLAAGKDPDGG